MATSIHTAQAKCSRAARMRLLTETGPGTPMGRLLRRFWQPVAAVADLPIGAARELRIMGEALTLYRGESGAAYLIGGRCAHRCTVLHTGWVKDEQIRCMYHGWRYDGTGRCTEMPAETKQDPARVRIAAYPVREYGGVFFAYLGEDEAPAFALPRKAELEEANRHVFCLRPYVWDTNWFQLIENSLDAAHVSFVHAWGRVERFSAEISTAIPELSYQETGAGMRQIAKRGPGNIRVSDWTFPNNNHIIVPGNGPTDPWIDLYPWVVPVDDEHAMRFVIASFPRSDAETTARILEEYTAEYNPMDHYEDLFMHHHVPDVTGLRFIATQDYVAARGQGRIADRVNERLGSSDAGIAMLRQIFWRELDAITANQPLKAWTKLEQSAEMPTPVHAGAQG